MAPEQLCGSPANARATFFRTVFSLRMPAGAGLPLAVKPSSYNSDTNRRRPHTLCRQPTPGKLFSGVGELIAALQNRRTALRREKKSSTHFVALRSRPLPARESL